MFTIFPINLDIDKSHGSYLFDKASKTEFLDFYSFYSSLPLGYNHPVFGEDFSREIMNMAKHRIATNVFRIDPILEFIENFRPYVFSSHIHFTCTGALAVESAIKCALLEKKYKNPLVLSVTNSFHGINSWGLLTDRVGFTGKRMEHFPSNHWKNVSLNEMIEGIENNRFPELAAVVIEPIQCTAGDLYLDPDLLRKLRKLTQEKNICLILDEIQTGFGTSGSFWYYEQLGFTPDILVFGKKSQICGIVANEQYSEAITSPLMKLHVTFDGEVIDAIRGKYILKAYKEGKLIEKARAREGFFREALAPISKNLRIAGHLIAFDFSTQTERDAFLKKCYNEKFLCNSAGATAIRMRPNMAVSDQELKAFSDVIKKVADQR